MQAQTFFPERQVMQSSPKTHATKNAYILARCTSRDFVQAFLASRAFIEKFSIKDKLTATVERLHGDYWRAFTSSFNPQRRSRRKLYKMRSKPIASKRYFLKGCSRKILPLSLKTKKQACRSKQAICLEVRGYRGIGPFLAKNLWQFFRLGEFHGIYPAKQDLAFGEVGPGGRRGVNLMNGWPPGHGDAASWQTSFFFSHEAAVGNFELEDLLPKP